MASTLRSIALAGFALAVPLALASCGGDDGDNGIEPDTEGTIAVTVRVDGGARSDVPVNLFASGSNSATTTVNTGGNGVATFSDVEEGSWDVEVVLGSSLELEQGEEGRKSVTVTAGQTTNVSFDLVDTFEGQEVSAVEYQFNPSGTTISVGESVRWTNDGGEAHNVSPDGHSEWSGGDLGSGGSTFTHTFDTPGTYDYVCTFHTAQNMRGTITVN